MNHFRLIGMAGAVLALSGCGSDPATQPPVDMQPGQYEVSVAGAPMGFAVAAQKLPSRCVSNSPANVPTALVRPYLALHEECSGAKFERKGNQLTGRAVCSIADSELPGNIVMNFTGTIGKDGIDGSISTKINASSDNRDADLAIKVMNNLSIKFTARRTGDCSGGDNMKHAIQKPSRSGEEGGDWNE